MRRRQIVVMAVLGFLCSGLSPIGVPAARAWSSSAPIAATGAPRLAAPPEPKEPPALPQLHDGGPKNPKAAWQVAAVVDSVSTNGTAAALGEARANNMTVSGDGIRVIVEASDLAKAKSSVMASGAVLEAAAGGLIQVLATPAQLAVLLNGPGIAYVRTSLPHSEDAVAGQGVVSTNASSLQILGNTGVGVKVAVIDLGFAGLAAAQANGDIPVSVTSVDYCSGGFNTVTQHGTAVAEVVAEMAPGAQLYLICVATEVGLAQAESYAKANGIQIVNHSVAWFNSSRGDGSGAAGSPDATVADANANGILWVNAAGNHAQQHWSGTFVDDGSGWNDFSAGSDYNQFYLPSGASMCASLKWDSWPVTSQDYDLYLVRSSDGYVLASSRNPQTGSQQPTESACFANSTGVSQYFFVGIYKYSAVAAPRFDLFVSSSDASLPLQFSAAAGSVTEPASSPSAFAVGAVCWQGTAIEPFSSQGPTIDGRIKPDLSGPDAVSSFTYGGFAGCSAGTGFYGTSAAAPHVAGAAALVKSANPTFTVAQIKAYLQTSSRDLGTAGQDNVYGSGLLFLPTAPGKPTNLAASPGSATANLSWTAPGNGGSAITGYTVTETEQGLGAVACPMSGATSCTVSSLTNDTEYTFTVHAANAIGPGPESDPSNKVRPHVPTVPGRPTGVSATAGAGSALVSWAAPADNGGSSITSYVVTSAPDGKGCATNGSLNCTVSALTNGTSYTFTVVATNSAGPGPASDPSPPVTPISGSTYHAVTPIRILDTRYGTGLSGALSSHVARTFQVTGGVSGVPASATAVTGNLTATQQTSLGFLFLGPNPANNPSSSTLNFPVGDDRANAVTVALGAGGTLSVTYAAPILGPTAQVIFDVTGYFTPDVSGATYHSLTPTRLLDTRYGTGLSGVFSSHVARTFTVAGGIVPSNATAVTGNLTVTGQTSLGFLYVGPNPADNPTSSTLNFPLGDDRANAVTVALGAGGTLSVTYAAPALGKSAHVIFDVTGYFTPDLSGATYFPLNPTRVLDSRYSIGLSGTFGSHVARTFGATAGGTGVPGYATAITGNLTVTQQTSLGFLYLGPNAADNPTSSTLNFPLGDDRANAVTVAVGPGGSLSTTYAAPTLGPTAQVILDVTGYFARQVG